MSEPARIRCRVAACPLGGPWEFYLINDSVQALDWAVLKEIGYEWGELTNTEIVNVRVPRLAPGAYARVWTDNGDGAELRMYLMFQISMGNREGPLTFGFPKLYMKRDLPLVPGLGRAGWQEADKF